MGQGRRPPWELGGRGWVLAEGLAEAQSFWLSPWQPSGPRRNLLFAQVACLCFVGLEGRARRALCARGLGSVITHL